MGAMRAIAVAAVAVVMMVALALPSSHGHAVMLEPKSRQWLDYLWHYNYLPHGANGGGKARVSNDFTLTWPNRNVSGVCGDAAGHRKWSIPGPVQGAYAPGDTLDVDVLFAQNHLGRLSLRVCPSNAATTADCKELKRTDGRGAGFDLPMTPDFWGVTSGFVKPLSTEGGGFSLYQMPPVGRDQGCKAWSCDQFKGMYVYRTRWQLPRGFSCDACMLQMHYLTGSSCWPPCKGGGCKKPVAWAYCDAPGASYPEEFWNCADISIRRRRRHHRRQLRGDSAQ